MNQILLLKLTLAPALVLLASLAGRRWGNGMGGQVAGAFPIISGPILYFFALEQGLSFGAAAAAGGIMGLLPLAAYCVAYTRGSGPWGACLAAGYAAYALCIWGLKEFPLPWTRGLPLAMLVLYVAPLLMPKRSEPKVLPAPGIWDLPFRAAAAVAIVLILTGLAAALGPDLSGILTLFPVASTVLTVFAHRASGPASAEKVLKGMLKGLFGSAFFLAVVSATLESLGIIPAFGLGLFAAVATQAVFYLAAKKQR